jgi:hypothetical protein
MTYAIAGALALIVLNLLVWAAVVWSAERDRGRRRRWRDSRRG